MTGKEAIKVLLDEWKCIDRNDGINCDRKCEKCDLVMDSAILKEAYNMAIKALEQEPCDDVVSRQAVLDELNKWEWQELYLPIHFKENIIDVVPSVRPQEQTGHWIMDRKLERRTCDNCNKEYRWSFYPHNYCPNCGAKMESD